MLHELMVPRAMARLLVKLELLDAMHKSITCKSPESSQQEESTDPVAFNFSPASLRSGFPHKPAAKCDLVLALLGICISMCTCFTQTLS
jgi:hypothetical protein